jgi:hypothetical protein
MRRRHRRAAPPVHRPEVRDGDRVPDADPPLEPQVPFTEEIPAAPPLAVTKNPDCCSVVRRRELIGQTVAFVVTHDLRCPVWSAR